jgi:hypothetical protein
MNWKLFWIGCGWFAIAQSITWFTSNLQLVYPWLKTTKGIGLMVIASMPATIGYIMGTKHLYEATSTLWSVRLLGFSMGVLTFTIWTYLIMKEGITMKTAVSLALSVVIVLLQVFWKTK